MQSEAAVRDTQKPEAHEDPRAADFRGLVSEATKALYRAMRKTQIVRMQAERGDGPDPALVDGIASALRAALYSFECVESTGGRILAESRPSAPPAPSDAAPESGTLPVAKPVEETQVATKPPRPSSLAVALGYHPGRWSDGTMVIAAAIFEDAPAIEPPRWTAIMDRIESASALMPVAPASETARDLAESIAESCDDLEVDLFEVENLGAGGVNAQLEHARAVVSNLRLYVAELRTQSGYVRHLHTAQEAGHAGEASEVAS